MKFQILVFIKSLKTSLILYAFLLIAIIVNVFLIRINNYSDSYAVIVYNSIICKSGDNFISNLYTIYYCLLVALISFRFMSYESSNSWEFIFLRESHKTVIIKKNILLIIFTIIFSSIYYFIVTTMFNNLVKTNIINMVQLDIKSLMISFIAMILALYKNSRR